MLVLHGEVLRVLDAEDEFAPGDPAAIVGDVDEDLEVGAEARGCCVSEIQDAAADVVCEPVGGGKVVRFGAVVRVSNDNVLVVRVWADR